MYFYQAHYPDGTFGELRSKLEEAMADLDAAGNDSSQLVEKAHGLWYTPTSHHPSYGIAVTHV